MSSLITFIVIAVIASFVESAMKGNKNKQGSTNQRPVAGRQPVRPVSSAEMLKQIVNQQVVTMSAKKQTSGNEADWSDTFDDEAPNPVEGLAGGSDGNAVSNEGKYLTDKNIGFGVLSYNSDEGKELEADNLRQITVPQEEQRQSEQDENYLDIDRTDFQKAFVLSEILGRPKAFSQPYGLKLKTK